RPWSRSTTPPRSPPRSVRKWPRREPRIASAASRRPRALSMLARCRPTSRRYSGGAEMNRLQVRYSTLADAFTLFGVLFYTQVIGFFLRLGNVSTLDDAQQDLEGNLANQVCG